MKVLEFIKKKKEYIYLLIVLLISSTLFYRYIYDLETSDYLTHIRHSLRGEGYSIITILFPLCIRITNSNILIVFLMSAFIILTVLASSMFLKTLLKCMDLNVEQKDLILLSCSFLFICKICIPEWSPYYYRGSYATQPWHNSTYIAMRLFGVLTLMFYYLIQKDYLDDLDLKKYAAFTVLLFLTNLSKPNFVLVFGPVMLAVLMIDFFKTKGKSFKNAFLFGVCVLLACGILVYQYKIVFPSSGESGGIAFSASHAANVIFSDNKSILHLLLNYTFPIYVSCLYFKNGLGKERLNRILFVQTWAMAVLSIFVSLFIVETGPRSADGNFGWGNPFFSYMLFMVSSIFLAKMKKQNSITDSEYTTANNILFVHLLFGLFYFGLLLMGYLSWGI